MPIYSFYLIQTVSSHFLLFMNSSNLGCIIENSVGKFHTQTSSNQDMIAFWCALHFMWHFCHFCSFLKEIHTAASATILSDSPEFLDGWIPYVTRTWFVLEHALKRKSVFSFDQIGKKHKKYFTGLERSDNNQRPVLFPFPALLSTLLRSHPKNKNSNLLRSYGLDLYGLLVKRGQCYYIQTD